MPPWLSARLPSGVTPMRRAAVALAFFAAQAWAATSVRIEPATPFNGSPCVVRAVAEAEPKGSFLDRALRFARDAKKDEWIAFCGVPLDTKPGSYPLTVDGETANVRVIERQYRVSTVTVEPRFLEPPPDETARIEAEREFKKKIFAVVGGRAWSLPFQRPTRTIETSPFGSRRVYNNGATRSVHQGLDFRAAPGTPIRAINAGRVVIARPMYFEGGLVAIDHGDGLFSLYMHLSDFVAKEGDAVEAGQVVAKSGSTGRSAAPHLHLGVLWQGTYLEPSTLFRLGVAPARAGKRTGGRRVRR